MDVMVTDDGCPVEAYAAMPPQPELDHVLGLLGEARTVLDLGCGAGRIANPLATRGLLVTGVDSSTAMLSHVAEGVRRVHSTIEGLTLDSTFDAVLLLSNLINLPDPTPLLDSARRHLATGGRLIAQRLPVGADWRPGTSHSGPVTIALANIRRDGDRIDATTTYTVGGKSWQQPWTLHERDDQQITRILRDAGFADIHLDGLWCAASAA